MSMRVVLAFVIAVVAGMGCNGDGEDKIERTSINVFAAASLTDAFDEIGERFAESHPIDVTFNFGGSPALRAQMEQGADADVLATADEENMQAAVDAGLVSPGVETFARNRLVIIVPASNPANIRLLADIATPGLRTVIAAPEVPVGRYTRAVLDNIAEDEGFVPGFRETVLGNVVSEEPNVKAVVAKVQLGEADMGFAYASDVTKDLEEELGVVDIPLDYNVEATYPIAVTSEARNAAAARTFIDFVLGEEGQAILEDHGFLVAE